jgi:hypothetical protein
MSEVRILRIHRRESKVMTNKLNYHLTRMEYHRKELEKLTFWGDDNMPDGTVIYFEKSFRPNGRKYRYVALKSSGKWYPSGPKRNGEPMEWIALIDFISEGVEEVMVADHFILLAEAQAHYEEPKYEEYQ